MSPPPLPRARRRLGEAGPTLLVAGLALGLGLWTDRAALLDPTQLGPRTAFTPGQTLAAAVAVAQVQTTGLATWTPLLGWPSGADYRAVMWPTQLVALLTGPVLAVNLAFVTIPAFNALAGGWLGRRLGLDRWGAGVVAAGCASAPWVGETLANGQLEQAVVGTVALLWGLGVGVLRRGGVVAAPTMALAALAAGLTAPHLLMSAGVGLGLGAAAFVLGSGPRVRGAPILGRGARLGRAAAALGGAALGAGLALAYQAGNFSAEHMVLAPKGSAGHPAWLGDVPETVTLSSLLWPPAPAGEAVVLHPAWLGLVPLLAGFVALWRRPRLAAGALVVAGVLVLLAFGGELRVGGATIPLPFRLLEALSPAIRASASPYRMVGGAAVALAVVAGAAVRGRVGFGLVALALFVEARLGAARPLAFATTPFPRDPPVLAASDRRGAVLDLPLIGRDCPDAGYHYALEALARGRPTPLVVASPVPYPTLPGLGRLFAGPDCAATLKRELPGWGFEGVVLHEHDPACKAPARLVRCLEEAFGEGTRARGVRAWEPLPVPPDVEPGSLRPPAPGGPPPGAAPAGGPPPPGGPPPATPPAPAPPSPSR